jgi:steroid delta-isomerase-like uncharacterized protein
MEIHDPSVTAHGMADEPLGLAELTQFYEGLWEAFPDVEATVEEMIAERDTVAFRVTLRGTHEGEFMGVPATGNRIEMAVQNFYHLREGKVVERWSNPDMMGLMVQLGAIPAPGTAA